MLTKISDLCRWSLLGLIVGIAAILMINATHGDSAIADELAHIPAGYSYLKFFDYRLNPEHPPLVKALAALPLLFQNLNFPVSSLAWQKDVNGQWAVGTEFIYQSGNDADKIIFSARLGPIILTLILVLAVYFFSKELIGRWWALLPAFLTAFSPTILAHGHYVTTDIGATLGILVATWAFLNFLDSPSKKNLFLAGLAFGFAQLTKFSAVLLIPYFLFSISIFYIVSVARDWTSTDPNRGRFKRFSIRAYHYFRSVFFIFLIGFALVFLVYLIFTWHYPIEKQVSDTESILAGIPFNFVGDFIVKLAGIPIFRAFAQYLLGIIMVFRRSAGGNTLYYLGEVSNVGHSSYFPLTFLWKEPPASLIFIVIAVIFSLWGIIKAAPAVLFRKSNQLLDYLTTHFPEFAMILFIAIYWLTSITSNLNIGVRHILPTLPFIYILTSGTIKKWFSFKDFQNTPSFVMKIFIVYKELLSISVKSALLAILLIGYLVSVAFTTPYFLSYFNFPSGGIRNGYRLVTDSNYDWGQDLKRLKTWVDENLPAKEKIAIDYFGGGNPKYYFGDRAENWWSARGNPINEGVKWLAVSINTIQIAKNPIGKVTSNFQRKPEDEYRWLTNPYEPYASAGTSIFIYKL